MAGKPKPEATEEDDEDGVKCVECDTWYDDDKTTRKIIARLGEFVCPLCMAEYMAKKRNEAKPPAPPAAPAQQKPGAK